MKNLLYSMPTWAQRQLNWRLRSIRDFPVWQSNRSFYHLFSCMNTEEKKQWIFKNVRNVTLYAQQNNVFYRRYYRSVGFDAECLKYYEDLHHIPIVTKEMLRTAETDWLRQDSNQNYGNTGGTSGSPLKFCSSRIQIIRERFYMNLIWNRIGCSPKHTRAVFRGQNLGDAPWVYNSHDDAYYVNSYLPISKIAEALEILFNKHRIYYLHGYPSSLYHFAQNCLREEYAQLRLSVNQNLKGILMGSEYPSPQYRAVIEKTFPVLNISWYGHSEMTILASENGTPFSYEPFHSYGFCEAVPAEVNQFHLVGTCYDNLASPFIRYDTGDSILPEGIEDNLLISFQIKNGRLGEFVLDRSEHPVSLTALIFGRHHKIFEYAEFVQISQNIPGHAVLHVTSSKPVNTDQMMDWFDLSNIDIQFEIEHREHPVRTPRGKIPLLIQNIVVSEQSGE